MAEPSARTRGRTPLATTALAVAAASALGIIIILVGIVLDIEGAREGEEGSVVFEIAWGAFLLGAIASLILGVAALLVGRRRADPGTARAGSIALGWFVIAVLIFVVAAVLSS
jgi:hypothetical protein